MYHFAPTIKIDNETVAPKGYEWILGFALAGCSWAIKEANNPEFIKNIKSDLKRQKMKNLKRIIQQYKNRITELKNEIDGYI